MILSGILLLIGLVVLLKGADFLVSGASSLALKLKIAPIVIGLTVVAFGTSAPELVASVTGALKGTTGLAFGNVVGSNIANILVILGITAIIAPLKVKSNTVWKEIPMSLLGACVLTVLGLQTILDSGMVNNLSLTGLSQVGKISLSNGIILLSFFIIFIYYTFGIARVHGEEDEEIIQLSGIRSAIYIAAGVLGLGIGSTLMVDNAVTLAKIFGVSDTLIGLTIIALGTSLPELTTSIKAALKNQSEIAVGNVVGSNIFNIFLILGVTSLIRPIPIIGNNVFDIAVLLAATIFLFVTVFLFRKHRIDKWEGIFMVVCYLIYFSIIVVRG